MFDSDQNGFATPITNGINGSSDTEMHSAVRKYHVEFEDLYGIKPHRVDRRFSVNLSEQSYLPKFDNPRADWVVTAAFNAFRAFESGGLGVVRRLASVGTGAGTDMIAALETFPRLHSVAMTDLHQEVVDTAKANMLSSVEKADQHVREAALTAVGRPGDVLVPLKGQEPFDLIYENLPNIPLPRTGDLELAQTSSTFIGDRTADKVPHHVTSNLLDLHYVCLRQAKDLALLNPSGAVLSSVGGRVPIQAIMKMVESAGYTGRVLGLSWKAQSEPKAVIGGYAEHQKQGLGLVSFDLKHSPS
ncbi:MAG: hypothetical protein Q9213_002889 [Squamulea squamosa]